MCGVFGALGADVDGDLDTAIKRQWHRGPDARGSALIDIGWTKVALGGTRLSIVDLSDLPVPARFDYLGVSLSYNGEVYNWRELRTALSDGRPWMTDCDSEVIARAWRRWGPDMLHRFNGMFAFALVDERKKVVMLARDRAGEKPMFVRRHHGVFDFASEVKAFSGSLEEQQTPEQDVLEFDCLSTTPFKGIWRLGPGERLIFRRPRDLTSARPETWWSFPTEIDEGMSWDTAVDEAEAILVDAIRIRADTEVPTTALVSGGLDSAIVQAVARVPRVYCCTFPHDDMNWMDAAIQAAKGAEVVPITFGLGGAQAVMQYVAYHLDTPATWSALAHWFLAKVMAEDDIKVVLTGEGADELYAGYSRYRALYWVQQARTDPQLSGYQRIVDIVTSPSNDRTLARMLDRSPDGKSLDHALELVRRFSTTGDLVADMGRVEWHTTMQCLLRMADRMCSAFSIENRSPFFDYRLIELAARTPTRHKITPQWSKAVLREVARRVGVHDDIVNDQHKRGLVVPWNKWRNLSVDNPRGAWDRSDFAAAMKTAWRQAFDLQP